MILGNPSTPTTLGVWMDYSRDVISSPTLTLSNRDAAVLLAFLATLVAITGVRSWRISRFAMYMAFVPRQQHAEASINDQPLPQQVILRNSETATGAAIGLLSYTYINKAPKAAGTRQGVKGTLFSAIALGHWATFIALSILTSQIVLGRTVVSKATSSCGKWGPDVNSSDFSLVYNEMGLNATLDADNYVQNCYFNHIKSGIFDCERLMNQAMNISVSHDAECPFPDNVCRTKFALAVDTGNVNLAHLGINTRLAHELYFRRRSVCAPIHEELFFLETYTAANLSWFKPDEKLSIYRFVTPTDDFPLFDHLVRHDNRSLAYKLDAYYFPLPYPLPDTLAAPLHFRDQLRDGYHGPSIILLSGRGITFTHKSDDALWSVHTEVEYPNGTFRGLDLTKLPPKYRMDRVLNIIGCDERFQLCAKHSNRCLPWSGLLPLVDTKALDDRAISNTQIGRDLITAVSLLQNVIPDTSISEVIAGRDGSSALRASRHTNNGEQYYLEKEQWKTEVTYWFAVAMAKLQLGIFNTIQGPNGMRPNGTMNLWADSPMMNICGRVKYRSADHTSLSFVGVVVVIVVSVFLITVSLFDIIIDWVPKKWRGRWLMQWEASESLALLERQKRPEHDLERESSANAPQLFVEEARPKLT
ncbi:hypothetical protein BHE90_005000 [Fusarium euwallaceae]|uniref:Uncharacterized protein n=1 Tax=Fusarium euwallaceae TaxID=1147111 RepID=A0A430LXN5_9HYPO|nr:hypothetical protein BHE90_005000 [Fusarium euwallaceae]